MPHCDGIQATRQIRALGYNYPILGLSSYSENHNIKECMEAGMNTFIPKPIDKEKLRRAVKVFVPPTIAEGDEDAAAGPSSPKSENPPPSTALPSPTSISPTNTSNNASPEAEVPVSTANEASANLNVDANGSTTAANGKKPA